MIGHLGKNGIPHPSTCATCGRKTDRTYGCLLEVMVRGSQFPLRDADRDDLTGLVGRDEQRHAELIQQGAGNVCVYS